MLTTSAEYQTKVDAHARKIYGKIVINYTDALLDPNIDGTSTDENYTSWTDQIVNGRVDMSYKYACLDGLWVLGDGFGLAPATADQANSNEFGWWSASVSNGTGVINTSAQIVYSKRKVSGFYIAFDDKRLEYAVDFNVKFYDGASLVYTETVTGNTQTQLQVAFTQIDNIDKAVLNITKWSQNGTPVKVAEFTTQVIEEYTDENLCDFSVIEEREISNDNSIPTGNISSSQASICLINTNRKFDANNTLSRLYQLVKPNALVEIFIGVDTTVGIEYQPMFKGWVTEWDVPEDQKRASTTARDRLNLLTQTKITTSTVMEDKTFSEWFEIVLGDAGLSNSEYNIDTDLNGSNYIIPYMWFDNTSHRNALEILAQGSSSVVYVDRYGLIQVKLLSNFPAGVVKTFDRSDYTNKDNQPVYQNVANDISVTTSPLLKTTGVTVYETLSNDPEDIGASTTETYNIFYTDTPISDHVVSINPPVAGVSISAQSNYAWGSTIDVTNTGGATTFQFNVVGSTYAVQGQKTSNRTDSASINANGLSAFNYPKNRALQKKALADIIADDLLASFKDAQRDLTISFDVGGNPTIELGDTIAVVDLYATKEYKIISTEMNYDGGLSINHKGRV